MELLVGCGIVWLVGLASTWLLFSAFIKGISPLVSSEFPLKLWLIIGIIGSSITSLTQATPVPAVSSFAIGLGGAPATTHRGWPLPWYGLVGFDEIIAPFTFLIDTFVWVLLTCGLVHILCVLLYSIQNTVIRPVLVQGTVVGVIVLASVLPFILPTTLIMQWLGLR